MIGESLLYGSPATRGRWQNPNYQATNPDGTRNYDPNATRLSDKDREYNSVLRATDPLGLQGLFGIKKRKAPPGPLWNGRDGAFNSLLNGYEQGWSADQAIQDLLTNFKGSKEGLADFLEIAGPLYGGLEARRTEQGPGYQYLSDPRNWDMGAMAGYGAAAGNVGAQTRSAMQQAGNQLAASGLGRSTGNVAIQNMLMQQGVNQQSNLLANANMQAGQNRMLSANNQMEAQRMIAQMALGQGITPRITSPQGGTAGVSPGQAALQGGIAGAGAGATLGPYGAVIGGVVGAGAGYFGAR